MAPVASDKALALEPMGPAKKVKVKSLIEKLEEETEPKEQPKVYYELPHEVAEEDERKKEDLVLDPKEPIFVPGKNPRH